MVHRDDLIQPSMEGFSSPSLAVTQRPPVAPTEGCKGSGHLPTIDDHIKLAHLTIDHIEVALAQLDHLANYRVGSRELSITRTKLDEAKMWMTEGIIKLNKQRKPNQEVKPTEPSSHKTP